MPSDQPHSPRPADPGELDALMQDKLETHCRLQLSALLDGALATDEARFLLRRLQHDRDLAGSWERWQVYGDLMRGGMAHLLPADFSHRVSTALLAEAQVGATAASRTHAGWTRWAGGAALAASVAMAALFVVQRGPAGEPVKASGAPQLVAQAPVAQASAAAAPDDAVQEGAERVSPAPASTSVASSVQPAPELPGSGAEGAAAAVLMAVQAPRRNAARAPRRVAPSVLTQPTPASRSAAPMVTGEEPDTALAVAAQTPAHDPFLAESGPAQRPWPRAVMPGGLGSPFSAAYGSAAPDQGGFDYFRPQLPAQAEPEQR